jgi:hypothetical protein
VKVYAGHKAHREFNFVSDEHEQTLQRSAKSYPRGAQPADLNIRFTQWEQAVIPSAR